MARKFVSSATVRTWGRENIDLVPEAGRKCLGPKSRGLLNPALIAAFRKANKGLDYKSATAEDKTVTFKAVVLDKAGRKTTREVTLTVPEARKVLGHEEGRTGALPLKTLIAAYEAQVAAEAAATFTVAA